MTDISTGDRVRLLGDSEEDAVVLQSFMTANYVDCYLVCTNDYELKAVQYYKLRKPREDEDDD